MKKLLKGIRLVNKVLGLVFGIELTRGSARSKFFAERVFRKSRLKMSSHRDLYMLDPMPSEVGLRKYYARLYWPNRGGKVSLVNPRDIAHWYMIRDLHPSMESSQLKLLNFGSGHGCFLLAK